jgi:hypothetical protein
MTRKNKQKRPVVVGALAGFEPILSGFVGLLENARRMSARAVNSVITATYWEIGRRIVQYEQIGFSIWSTQARRFPRHCLGNRSPRFPRHCLTNDSQAGQRLKLLKGKALRPWQSHKLWHQLRQIRCLWGGQS